MKIESKYFKDQWDPKVLCYYRVLPDGSYEYYDDMVSSPERFKWRPGNYGSWESRCNAWAIHKPIEVSELEVLVVLGVKATQHQ